MKQLIKISGVGMVFMAALVILSIPSLAQRHHFVTYSVQDGLAQSQVRDIIQSKDGHLWVATIGGVSKFDGINFVNYNKANGLLNNVVTAIHETSDGDILIACQGGIVQINDNDIKQYPFENELSETIVLDIIEFNGTTFLATNGKGLLTYKNGIIVQNQFQSKKENFIRSLEICDDRMLLGSKNGVLSISGKDTNWILTKSSINKVIAHEEEIWIATTENGIFLISKEDTTHFAIENGLTSRTQKDITVDRDGTPWFISKNGIAKYNRTNGAIENIVATETSTIDNLKVVFADHSNNIWLGTSGSGLLKFTGTHAANFGIKDGLPSDQVMAITQDKNGALWFGTYGSGVAKLEKDAFETFDFNRGLTNNTIWSLISVGEEVWVGTSDGVSIISNNLIKPFEHNDSLPFARVSSMHLDSEGSIWFGTRDGIVRYGQNRFTTPNILMNEAFTEVKSIVELNKVVWFSTRSGIFGFDLNADKIIQPNDSLLRASYISSITTINSTIWAGTDEGIIGYNTSDSSVIHFDISPSPSANIVNFLITDELQNLWVGTDNGLFSINPMNSNPSIRSYNEHDGIIGRECNQNAAFRDSLGRIWLGLNGNLVSIIPEKIVSPMVYHSSAKLLEVLLDFEPIDFKDYYDSTTNSLVFDYNKRRITLRFSAIHFANPDKLEYSYRLVGSDDDWSPANKESSVTYANLSPGKYQFEAKIRLENTDWIEEMELVRFNVLPPFYLTWWFFVLSAIFLLGISYWTYQTIRTQRKRRQDLIDIQNQAKILGLEQQTLNAHMNRHFIFNALNSIQYYINTKERKLASQYLTQFAALVRKNLDSAQEQSITLKEEIDRLKLYMNLEQMRFKDQFDYSFDFHGSLDLTSLYVPSMILQPFIENSIMHGILPSERHGLIEIRIHDKGESIVFEIIDNGIGIQTSVARKPQTGVHVSNGMKITRQRLEVLSNIHGENYGVVGPVEVINEKGESTGTRVSITLPKLKRTREISAPMA